MGIEGEVLSEAIVFGLLAGAGFAWTAAIGMAQVRWRYRVLFPIAITGLLLPTKAYELIFYFLLTTAEILILLAVIDRWRVLSDASNPARRAATFTLRSLLIATVLIAASLGVRVALHDKIDLPAQVMSSIASSSIVVVAVSSALSGKRRLSRLSVLGAAVLAATTIWHFFSFIGFGDTRFATVSTTTLMMGNAVFGLVLASFTWIVATASRAQTVPLWRIMITRCITAPLMLAALTFGGFFFYRLAKPIAIPPRQLPDPNGDAYFAQARELLHDVRVPDVGFNPPKVVSEFADEHRQTLVLVRKGLELECRTTLVWKEGSEYYISDIEPSQGARKIALTFEAEAFSYEQCKDSEQAAQSHVDSIRFAHEMSRGGGVTHFLTAKGIEDGGLRELRRLLLHLDPPTCRAAAAQLLSVDAKQEPVIENARIEALFSQVTGGWIVRLWIAMDDLFNRSFRYLSDRSELQNIQMRHDAFRRLLIIELAIRAFTLDKGTHPQQLNELVPDYLARIPSDPYDDAPLRFRADETSSVVYSIGPDLDDDLSDDGDLVLSNVTDPGW